MEYKIETKVVFSGVLKTLTRQNPVLGLAKETPYRSWKANVLRSAFRADNLMAAFLGWTIFNVADKSPRLSSPAELSCWVSDNLPGTKFASKDSPNCWRANLFREVSETIISYIASRIGEWDYVATKSYVENCASVATATAVQKYGKQYMDEGVLYDDAFYQRVFDVFIGISLYREMPVLDEHEVLQGGRPSQAN